MQTYVQIKIIQAIHVQRQNKKDELCLHTSVHKSKI